MFIVSAVPEMWAAPRSDKGGIIHLFVYLLFIQGDTRKRELLKNPTKIEEI